MFGTALSEPMAQSPALNSSPEALSSHMILCKSVGHVAGRRFAPSARALLVHFKLTGRFVMSGNERSTTISTSDFEAKPAQAEESPAAGGRDKRETPQADKAKPMVGRVSEAPYSPLLIKPLGDSE
ncbi:hypothetical protein [Inquilinus sp.]|uniref:hypothetical protein n=1 Tax=Inquilinus sp. TaxID=1932117 RepID=UPI003784F701